MVGKWNLGDYTEPMLPHRRGFKTFLGYLATGETYWYHKVGGLTLACGASQLKLGAVCRGLLSPFVCSRSYRVGSDGSENGVRCCFSAVRRLE